MRGASPFITTPASIQGFQNLIAYYGEIAYPVFNSTADTDPGFSQTNFLGNDAQNAQDNVDMVQQLVMSTVVAEPLDDSTNIYTLNNNGEFTWTTNPVGTSSAIEQPTVGAEKFTVSGATVTLTAGSSTVVGAGGTTWTTDTLVGGYGVTHPGLNKIHGGDILRVFISGTRWISFRITSVTNNTHLEIYPTPTAGNPAVGAGKTYSIWRSGYNSKSRVIAFSIGSQAYFYYAGNLGNGSSAYPYGTIQAVAHLITQSAFAHYMAPRTVDSSGAQVADIQADDLIYYKGFILYGAGGSISWSVPGAPSTIPFADTDFPAKNISIVDPTSKFVSFEYLGDQVVAFFEDSTWLVTPTGSVPEFAFYKLPELESIINPGLPEVSGGSFDGRITTNYGRPSTSGRGTIYYVSNRGIESMGGGLSEEISRPVSTAIQSLFGSNPLYVGWDNAQDTLLVRSAGFDASHLLAMVYNPPTRDWSTLKFGPPQGAKVAALTPSIQPLPRTQDHTRLFHYGYYDVLGPGGTPPTSGGNVNVVVGTLDQNSPTAGIFPWIWQTPVLPMGLNYPDFSTGGFVFDAYSLNVAAPVQVTWLMYYGSSPYNLSQWDSGTMTFQGTLASPWVSSRQRLSKKSDAPFIMFEFTSVTWVGIVAMTLFDAQTQAMR